MTPAEQKKTTYSGLEQNIEEVDMDISSKNETYSDPFIERNALIS